MRCMHARPHRRKDQPGNSRQERDFRDRDHGFFVETETRDFLLKIRDFETEFRDFL